MKKSLFILIILFFSLGLISCDKTVELPIEEIEENKEIIVTEKTVKDFENNEDIIEKFIETFYSFKSYKIEYAGESVAHTIINYTQKIEGVVIRNNDDCYQRSRSTSLFVKQYHEMNYVNNELSYYHNNEGLKSDTLENYKAEFGIFPTDQNLFGYIITKDNISDITLVSEENEIYKFSFNLEPENNAKASQIQMKKMGDLNDLPIFKTINFVIKITSNFTPISVIVTTNYTVDKLFGNMDCDQVLTYVFKDLNQEITYDFPQQ